MKTSHIINYNTASESEFPSMIIYSNLKKPRSRKSLIVMEIMILPDLKCSLNIS